MIDSIRKALDRLTPRALNWVSRISFVVSVAGILLALLFPQIQVVSGITAIVSAGLLLSTREISHIRNQSLRAQVGQLEGRPLPQESTAAGLYGQGELATMNYSQLVERLRRDGHIG